MAVPQTLSGRTIKALRVTASVTGLLMLTGALLADSLGLSASGIGRGQLLLAFSGIALLLLSFVRHPARAYSAARNKPGWSSGDVVTLGARSSFLSGRPYDHGARKG